MQKKYQVYFIEQQFPGKHKPVKVGYSTDAYARVSGLQTGSPYRLRICALMDCENKKQAIKLEKCFHWLLKKRARPLQGEWFILTNMSWKRIIEQTMKLYGKDDIGYVTIKGAGPSKKAEENIIKAHEKNARLVNKINELQEENESLRRQISGMKVVRRRLGAS